MPYKPKKPCAYPGCPNLTSSRYCELHQNIKQPCAYPGCPNLTEGRYCEEHLKLMKHRYEIYKRDPEVRKRYGRDWEKIREQYITKHPLCERCKRLGVFKPAEHVHHVLPLSEGGTNESKNLMSLCRSCHSKIHANMRIAARYDKGRGGKNL